MFKPISNPYIVGNPIKSSKMFYGREDDFEFIKRKLESGGKSYIIVLCGERRSGKTSILFQILNHKLGDDFIPILVDMQTMAGLKNESEFFEKFAKEIAGSLKNIVNISDYDFHSSTHSPYKEFSKMLDDIHRIQPDKKKLFLIDEYELIETKIEEGSLTENFIPMLAGVLESDRSISFIFTGSTKLEERKHKYWNLLFGKSLFRNVSFLSKKDTMRLIREPVQSEIQYEEDVFERIYRLTSGQPFYTQVVCQNIVDYVNEHQNPQIKSENFETIVNEILENPLPQMMYFWSSLSNESRLVLSLLSEILDGPDSWLIPEEIIKASKKRKFGLELSFNLLNTTLESLSYNHLVEKSEKGYRYQMDLFRQWIKRDHSIWRVMKEDTTLTRHDTQRFSRIEQDYSNGKSGKLKKTLLAAAFILIISLTVIWYFQPANHVDSQINEPKKAELKETGVAEHESEAIASRQSMLEVEDNSRKLNADKKSATVFAEAIDLKNKGEQAFKTSLFNEAILYFQQAENKFLEAMLASSFDKTSAKNAAKKLQANNTRRKVLNSKNSALRVNAENLSEFKNGLLNEKNANNNFASGDFDQANSLYKKALILFDKAKQIQITILKIKSQQAKSAMNNAKARADQNSAARLAPKIYANASEKEDEAATFLENNDFNLAASKYSEAEKLYLSSISTAASKNLDLIGKIENIKGALVGIKNKLNEDYSNLNEFQEAAKNESEAVYAFNKKNYNTANQKFNRAVNLYQKAYDRRKKQISQIHSTLNEYKTALENKNIGQMKTIEKKLQNELVNEWTPFFKVVDNLQIEMQIKNILFKKTFATADTEVKIKYSGSEENPLNKWKFKLAESSSGWIITNILKSN